MLSLLYFQTMNERGKIDLTRIFNLNIQKEKSRKENNSIKVSFSLIKQKYDFKKEFYFDIQYEEANYGYYFIEYIGYTYQLLFKNEQNIEIYPLNSNQLLNKFNTNNISNRFLLINYYGYIIIK